MLRKTIANQKDRLDDKNPDADGILVVEVKEIPINRHIGELLKKKFDTDVNSENSADVLSSFQSWTRSP